jgi:hypothetical protein
MADADRARVAIDLIEDPSQLMGFTDQMHQGMANWLTLGHALREVFPGLDAFRRPSQSGEPGVVQDPNGTGTNAGRLTYDSARVNYVGLSMGGILGGTLAAVSPDLSRVCLNVGGAGFTHIMFRSKSFAPFHLLMNAAISDPLQVQEYSATLQRHFDRIDPGIYARYIFDDKRPGSPADRQVLLQLGLGDTRVPEHTGYLLARSLGLAMTQPSPYDPGGVEVIEEGGGRSSGFTVYDFGVDTTFKALAKPPDHENEVHDGVRALAAAQDQMDAFFREDGHVENACDGPCDPE